ncbi:hypothetical protein LOAG_10254 [Loa loa]|uniref:Uncharacterized protein n=1 Tax=Loa loa TaxID=7209 RepID=A0A1S0TQ97_LOALO|nr:hypothetical protein LOAG_10254 [Loa loa]EFO18239.1 hypothetical protein LOAG_10254 [Loa loa]
MKFIALMCALESTIWITTTAPCYYCDHGHLRDQYEDQYQIIASSEFEYFPYIAVTLNAEDKKAVENIVDGQKRWRKVIIEAMEVQRARHYKQSLNLHHRPILDNNDNRSIDVQVCHLLEQTQCSKVKA